MIYSDCNHHIKKHPGVNLYLMKKISNTQNISCNKALYRKSVILPV